MFARGVGVVTLLHPSNNRHPSRIALVPFPTGSKVFDRNFEGLVVRDKKGLLRKIERLISSRGVDDTAPPARPSAEGVRWA